MGSIETKRRDHPFSGLDRDRPFSGLDRDRKWVSGVRRVGHRGPLSRGSSGWCPYSQADPVEPRGTRGERRDSEGVVPRVSVPSRPRSQAGTGCGRSTRRPTRVGRNLPDPKGLTGDGTETGLVTVDPIGDTEPSGSYTANWERTEFWGPRGVPGRTTPLPSLPDRDPVYGPRIVHTQKGGVSGGEGFARPSSSEFLTVGVSLGF